MQILWRCSVRVSNPGPALRAALPWVSLTLTVLLGGCSDPSAFELSQMEATRSAQDALERDDGQGVDGLTYLANQPRAVRSKSSAPHRDGAWSDVKPWPIIPIHAVLTPDGRMLSYGTDTSGKQTGYFVYDIWTPSLGFGDEAHQVLPNTTQTDIFCSSQVVLPKETGKIFIAGGDIWTGTRTTLSGNNNSNVFSYEDNSLVRGPDMNIERWYSTTTMLVDGEAYVQGGTPGSDYPEVRDHDGNFRLLTDLSVRGMGAVFPRNFVVPGGRIFGFGVNGSIYWADPLGFGPLPFKKVGRIPDGSVGTQGSATMFRVGRILQVGGRSATSVVIDGTRGEIPSVNFAGPISSLRLNLTTTLLADGSVIATGGSDEYNKLVGVNLHAERFDPRTGLWSLGAPGALPRLYHSIAVLLPDASLLVGGGGAPGPLNNRNVEVYYPPYLYQADGTFAPRPEILSAPGELRVGESFGLTVGESDRITRVTLLKTGSVTHSLNMDQRFLELAFTANGSLLTVDMSEQAGDTPPGYYMVFVFDDKGVPSIARSMWINVAPPIDTANAPAVHMPDDRRDFAGSSISLAVQASDPNGDTLQFSAGGLPPGMQMDSATGVISGVPTDIGMFYPTVAVGDGRLSASKAFAWEIAADETPVVFDPIESAGPVSTQAQSSFTAHASGYGLNYRWNFGDGSTPTDFSSSPEVTHQFLSAGVHTVTVTARAPDGSEVSYSFQQVVYLPPVIGRRPVASTGIAVEQRGEGAERLWLVNPDNDSVSVLDAATGERLAEIAVGKSPRSLAIDRNGVVWVSNRRSGTINLIDAQSLSVFRKINLPRASQPVGIVISPVHDHAYVALSGTGQLMRIRTDTYAKSAPVDVAGDVRHISISADGLSAWISRFITPPQPGESTALVSTTVDGVETGGQLIRMQLPGMSLTGTTTLQFSNMMDFENQGRGVPNYLGAAALSPDGTQAWVPSKQDNIQRGTLRDGNNLNFQNTVRAIVSRIDLATTSEDYPSRMDLDNSSQASAALFDPLGVFLFVALETSREVAIIDAHRRIELMRLDVGLAPQSLTLSSNGQTLYVSNFMDRTVSVFDVSALAQGSLQVTDLGLWSAIAEEQLTPSVLLGKQLFYDARDPRLSRDSYMSCASCHEDGGHDGRTWDLTGMGEGLRNTVALRGRGGAQGFQHWSGNFDEVQDFEMQIRELAGGTGLMNDPDLAVGTRSSPLGDPKAGVSVALDALAAYLQSLNTFDDSPYRASASALTPAGELGKSIFKQKRCASCHGTGEFTTSGPDTLVDVGTLKPSSGSRLGEALTGIDTPTLRDAWSTAPYLHDGSALSVEAAIRAHRDVVINDADLANLAAYVRQIGREEKTPVVATQTGTGLKAEYFNNMALNGVPAMTTVEAVNFSVRDAPVDGVDEDAFSTRWSGFVRVALSGAYTFQTIANDGIRVWLDGQMLIDNWSPHAVNQTVTSEPVTLSSTEDVPIVVEYYDVSGNATARLRWSRPGDDRFVVVPVTQLFPAD